MNLYLIGYRCSGKTSVGKALADRLQWGFFDCDKALVAEAGKSIREIVEDRGWEAFRRLEQDVLRRAGREKRLVVATGGGVILDPENLRLMKRTGVVVWLKAQASTIRRRISEDRTSQNFRPPLSEKGALDEIEEVLSDRLALYEAAMDLSVETDLDSVETVCSRIAEELKKRQKSEVRGWKSKITNSKHQISNNKTK